VKRLLRVIATYENIENKGDVDWEHSQFLREFKLVPVIDILAEVSWFRTLGDFNLWLDV
jgi:hypothetical protein